MPYHFEGKEPGPLHHIWAFSEGVEWHGKQQKKGSGREASQEQILKVESEVEDATCRVDPRAKCRVA